MSSANLWDVLTTSDDSSDETAPTHKPSTAWADMTEDDEEEEEEKKEVKKTTNKVTPTVTKGIVEAGWSTQKRRVARPAATKDVSSDKKEAASDIKLDPREITKWDCKDHLTAECKTADCKLVHRAVCVFFQSGQCTRTDDTCWFVHRQASKGSSNDACAHHIMSRGGCTNKECKLKHAELCLTIHDAKTTCNKLHLHHTARTVHCKVCNRTRLPSQSTFSTCQQCWKAKARGKPCATPHCAGTALPKTSHCSLKCRASGQAQEPIRVPCRGCRVEKPVTKDFCEARGWVCTFCRMPF